MRGSRASATRASGRCSERFTRGRRVAAPRAGGSARSPSWTRVCAAQGYLSRPRIGLSALLLSRAVHVMATTTETELRGPVGLAHHGLRPVGRVHWNPTTALLYPHALLRGEGVLAEGGPLVVDTGRFTGRSPKDKFVVREPGSEERIWWGTVNQPLAEEHFE